MTKRLCCLVFALALLLPAAAFAQPQCESPADPPAAAASVGTMQAAEVGSLTSALETSYLADETTAKTTLLASLVAMDKSILSELNWWWGQWETSLKAMTAQLNSGAIDQTRQLAGFNDSGDISAAQLAGERAKIAGHKLYQPTAEACRFDTAARSFAGGRALSKAMATGYALDFNKIGNADAATPAGGGPAALQNARWKVYQSKFCDAKSNNGAAGCGQSALAANMDVLPSKTIFSKLTLDYANPAMADAVNQLLFNITGYQPRELIAAGALGSALGVSQQLRDRSYIAQMDAVGALAYSAVADRTPGQPAPGIQLLRLTEGANDASPTPSAREIREAILEQLWDPNYYNGLYDSPATIAQKDLYLKAYGLVMLYDMIGKQEKISNAYAIETADMLDRFDHSRGSVSEHATFQTGGGTP